MHLGRTAVGRAAVIVTVTGTLAAGLFAGAPGVAAAPPKPGPAPTDPGVPNPTDGQLSAADAQRNALDGQIGALSGEIAAAQSKLADLQRKSELAEQRVAYAITQARQAKAEQAAATRALQSEFAERARVRVGFARLMQASYADGRPGGVTGTLLTAADPTALLDQTSYRQYEIERSAGIVGQMETVTLKVSNAEARAKRATVRAQDKQREAVKAQEAAAVAVQNQQSQEASLESTMSTKQTELTAAKAQQVQLYAYRAQHTQYAAAKVEYNREVASYNAYVAEQRRQAEIRRQERLERARQKAAAERAKARAKKNHDKGGGNGGGSNNGGSRNDDPPAYNPPPPSSSGGWSSAKAARAVKRAKSTLGTPYAWAGGGVGGPSYGACVPSAGAPNDCYIRGYDCSGLVMYAWGRNWDHYADTQYSQAGSYHPSRNKLKPGDLVFFGYRGGGSDLHHVAMYLGGGRIIEAPYSGGYVQYNRLSAYSDYYGATRPLT